jgi:hypothetical protein
LDAHDSFLPEPSIGQWFAHDGDNQMSKETPKGDPRQETDAPSHSQTDKPWKGNPEKEQRNDGSKIDLEKWHKSSTH